MGSSKADCLSHCIHLIVESNSLICALGEWMDNCVIRGKFLTVLLLSIFIFKMGIMIGTYLLRASWGLAKRTHGQEAYHLHSRCSIQCLCSFVDNDHDNNATVCLSICMIILWLYIIHITSPCSEISTASLANHHMAYQVPVFLSVHSESIHVKLKANIELSLGSMSGSRRHCLHVLPGGREIPIAASHDESLNSN